MSKIGDFWKLTKTIITLSDDIQKYHAEIKDVRKELRDLTIVVSGLAKEVEHSKDRAAAERKNLLLELENNILRLERRLSLPPAKDSEERQ